MLNELKMLIDKIITEHRKISELWKNHKDYLKINLKKSMVYEINKLGFMDSIINYVSFLNTNLIEFQLGLNEDNFKKSKINVRIKARNSILYKYDNYLKNHEDGKSPINKCFNDLFGIRIIFKEDISHSKIKEYLDNNYPNLKCIEALRKNYIATHIYFSYDNFTFPWELQIWSKCNEINNLESHRKYKQDYVKWEIENGKKEDYND